MNQKRILSSFLAFVLDVVCQHLIYILNAKIAQRTRPKPQEIVFITQNYSQRSRIFGSFPFCLPPFVLIRAQSWICLATLVSDLRDAVNRNQCRNLF